MTREREAGFSLIELLVAMTITLIVSGAIYGLLAGGQNAFRREPELTERQQNIRLAMDLIMRDTANAGVSLPPFTQVFTTGLDDDALSPPGPSGEQSDEYELLTGTNQESEPVCVNNTNGQGTQVYLTRTSVPPIDPDGPTPQARKVFLVFSSDPATNAEDRWTTRRLSDQDVDNYPSTAGTPDCSAGNHARLTLAGATPGNPTTLCEAAEEPPVGNISGGSGCTMAVTRIVYANQVRYRIRAEPDGVPVLERSSSEDGNPPTFHALARGIEEMQIQYASVGDPDVWLDEPPVVADPVAPTADIPGYATLVRQVRVTLTSRSEARNIQGATNNAGGADPRLRGTLVSTSTPRATLMHLARNRPPSPIPSPGLWYWE